MKSVGKAALAMVEEVRRQFNTIPGLMDGSARPDYRQCVEISTQVSWLLDPTCTPKPQEIGCRVLNELEGRRKYAGCDVFHSEKKHASRRH